MARRRTKAERLFALAKDAARHIEWEAGLGKLEKLNDALVDRFEAGDADTLYQALDLAVAAQEQEAVALIEEGLEYISAHQYAEENDSFSALTLFAVPVFLDIPPLFHLDSAYLKLGPAFAELEQSFQKAGLVRKTAKVALHYYLYHPHELDFLSYFDVAHLTVNMQAAMLDWQEVSAEQLAQTGVIYEDASTADYLRYELRYLLGIVQDTEPRLPFQPLDAGERVRAAYDHHLSEWQRLAMEAFPRCLDFTGMAKLDILKPQPFYEAYRQGLKSLWNSSLYRNLMEDLAHSKVLPNHTHALVVPYGAEGELLEYVVFVYALDNEDELLAARPRSVLTFENTNETRVEIVLVLKAIGIDDVTVLEELREWTTGSLREEALHMEIDEQGRVALPGNRTVH